MIRKRMDRALLLARTTRNLRTSQILHRARLRAQRFPPRLPLATSVIRILPQRIQSPTGWPTGFVALDLKLGEGCPTPEDNVEGRFRFLNDVRDLGRPQCWDPPGASRLWKYHLHYMEWAWSFAVHPDRQWARTAFNELWRSWERSVAFGHGDAWSPYVASLRAWVLCGTYEALVLGSEAQAAIDASLGRHARFLRWHLEHDVGGNHLIKNLKALLGLGLFRRNERLMSLATRELERQLTVQVLIDGGHYERSPSYHCQVLGDLIDIASLLASAGRTPVSGLADAINAMRSWLGLVLMPDGDVPLLNDCVLVGPSRLSQLRPGPPAVQRLTVLPSSGYVVIRPHSGLHLFADVGDACPSDLPAHAHADCLTFELAVDGNRVVVDSGTSTYEPGAQRAYERSTNAHNTVSVDGADQTEVWGTFRAGRLASGRLERVQDDGLTICVIASHDGFCRLPGSPVHRRTWRVTESRVVITDEVLGAGEHRIESRLHFAGSDVWRVVWYGPPDVNVSESPMKHATGFGRVHNGRVVSGSWRGEIPVTIRMDLHLDGVRSKVRKPATGTAGSGKGLT